MTKRINLGQMESGTLSLDLDTLLESRMLVQGNSRSGKSYLVRMACERAAGKVPIIIIDIEGEFASLRSVMDAVLVGPDGDIPTDLRSASLLARKLVELQVSAIIDIYDLKIHERREWVRRFLDALNNLPKELWSPLIVVIDEAHKLCLSADTDLLTVHGWRKYNEIAEGDLAATFDLATQTYKYEPIQDVIIREYKGEMIRLKSDGIDSLSTPEHRTVIRRTQRAQGRYKQYDWTFCEADSVPNHIYAPLAGAACGEGIEELSDDMLSLLGWIITDGNYQTGKRYLGITQAATTVKQGVQTVSVIDGLMKRLGGVGRYERNRPPTLQPDDNRFIPHAPSIDYYLGASLSRQAFEWLGTEIHRIPRRILEEASREQLSVLYEALMQGDGTGNDRHGWLAFFPGLDEGLADDFQELTAKLNISTIKRWREKAGQWVVHVSRRTQHYVRRPSREEYEGIVWDITVPSGAFIARRNGAMFVTGNCPEKGQGESVATQPVIDLMSQGGKRLFCGILITQRFSKLHNDAMAEANNVFIGRTWMDNDQERAGKYLGMSLAERRELRVLPQGEFYAFGPALSETGVIRFKGDKAITKPPKPGERSNFKPPKASDAIKDIVNQIDDLPEVAEQEARTIEEFRQQAKKRESDLLGEIQVLKADLAKAVVPTEEQVYLISDEKLAELQDRIDDYFKPFSQFVDNAQTTATRIESLVADMRGVIPAAPKHPFQALPARMAVAVDTEKKKVTTEWKPSKSPEQVRKNLIEPTGELTDNQRLMINGVGMLHRLGYNSPTLAQVGAVIGKYHNSGPIRGAFNKLHAQGYAVIDSDNHIQLTEMGLREASTPPVNSRAELHNMWLDRVKGNEQAFLRELIGQFPHAYELSDLGAAIGKNINSGPIRGALNSLADKGLAVIDGDSVIASAFLFPEGLA